MTTALMVDRNGQRTDETSLTSYPLDGQSATILQELRTMGDRFADSIKEVSDRVDKLSETVYGSPPAKRRHVAGSTRHAPVPVPSSRRVAEPTPSTSHWADRRDSGLDRSIPPWPNSDSEEDDSENEEPSTLELSESNKDLVRSSFALALSNTERRKIRGAFKVPEGLDHTRCPKLDAIFKSSLAKSEAKNNDGEMAKIQALLLDPAIPMLNLLHQLDTNPEYSIDHARQDVIDSVRLLGNASAQISRTRRKKVLKTLNSDLLDLAEEDELFKEAAPNLFGEGFEKRMRERAESVKLLSKVSKPTKPPDKPNQFFRKGRFTGPPRGSGQSRGGKTFSKKK